MDLQTAMRYVGINGWCLLDGIIPAGEVDAVRESVEAEVTPLFRHAVERN